MTVDRERLRRLALIARDDDQETTVHLAMTPAEAELAQALDPSTVLELLDRLTTAEQTPRLFRDRVHNSTDYRDEMLELLDGGTR